MAILKKQPPTPTLEDLQRQRSELAGRLGAVAGQLARLDPVNDWELASRALAEQAALERAVGALDQRIEAAQREQAAGAAGAREQERQERAAVARANLESKARAVCDLVQSFDAGALAELEAATRELGAAGGWPDPAAGVALRLAGAVDASLAQWRVHQPTWLGLPEPPSKEAQALAERQAAVARAERLLADARKLQREQRHGGPSVSPDLVLTFAHGLAGVTAGLLRLTEPDLTDHERTVKSNSGIPELAGWLGDYLERYNDAQRKAAATPASLLA